MCATRINPQPFVVTTTVGVLPLPPSPLIQQRDPTTDDEGFVGQLWINEVATTGFLLTSNTGGTNVWRLTT